MEKIIFYEPFFRPSSSNDINEKFDLYHLDESLILTDNISKHLSEKEIKLTISLLKEIKKIKTKHFNISNIDRLVIHTIGCNKRIIFKNEQGYLLGDKRNAHIFLIDYYVQDLIQEKKEETDIYVNLFKVFGVGTLFGIFSYLKN